MLLDCRSLEFELLPLPVEVRVVICNSMVKHAWRRESMVTGAMRLRRGRQSCGRSGSDIELLRDATLADLEACRDEMVRPASRCRHIIAENGRVMAAREALLQGK